jgi:hypothetical protein
MSGGSPPKPQPIPPPAPVIDREAEAQTAAYRGRIRKMRGRQSTILTGSSDLSPAGGAATLGGS